MERMMGFVLLVSVLAATIPIGFFKPSPLDDITINLNLDESPKGPSYGNGGHHWGQEEDADAIVAPGISRMCYAIDDRATDQYCTDNCNHIPPNCPQDFCQCEGRPPRPVGPGSCDEVKFFDCRNRFADVVATCALPPDYINLEKCIRDVIYGDRCTDCVCDLAKIVDDDIKCFDEEEEDITDASADQACPPHNYKTWFELISPTFKLNENVQPNMISQSLSTKIHNVIEELNNTVTNSAMLTKKSDLMWKAVEKKPFHKWCPRSFDELVHYLRVLLSQAPPYLPNTGTPGIPISGIPITNMLLCHLHTQEGRQFFALPQVNDVMIKMVDTYGEYLDTKESLNVLNDGTFGWKSECALKDLNYMKDFMYDETEEHWGFKSWNDFFTRRLKKGARPFVGKGNNKIIDAFGDNGFYNIEMDVQNDTKLMIKNESYSLFQMFDKNPSLSDQFIGGSVLHVYFSSSKYHHYHAPVSGKVTYAAIKHGIIYAVDEVNANSDEDKLNNLENWILHGTEGIINTQLYLAHISTRAIIIIENEFLGPVALVFIGMEEISSCRIEDHILKGYENGEPVYVEKGDVLGHFQYGGSSGLILLTKEVVQMKPTRPFWDFTEGNIKMGQPILKL